MIKSIETTGKTVDEAVESALRALKLSRTDVTIEVVSKPRAGFFGIGSADARVRIHYNEPPEQRAKGFLTELLQRMGVEAAVDAEQGEEGISMNVRGDNMGVVIGRRGDTLDALQYITSIVVNRGEESHLKVTIDTENYRKKREEALENLARKVGARVLKYKKSVTLEPMSAYERRVIHSTLQGMRGVTTHSTGSDPHRRVVVALAGVPRGGKNGVRGPKDDAPAQATAEAPAAKPVSSGRRRTREKTADDSSAS